MWKHNTFSSEVIKYWHRPSASHTFRHKNDLVEFRKIPDVWFHNRHQSSNSNPADQTEIHIQPPTRWSPRYRGSVTTGVHLMESVKETSCIYITHGATWQNDMTSSACSVARRFKRLLQTLDEALLHCSRRKSKKTQSRGLDGSYVRLSPKMFYGSSLEVRIYNFSTQGTFISSDLTREQQSDVTRYSPWRLSPCVLLTFSTL